MPINVLRLKKTRLTLKFAFAFLGMSLLLPDSALLWAQNGHETQQYIPWRQSEYIKSEAAEYDSPAVQFLSIFSLIARRI